MRVTIYVRMSQDAAGQGLGVARQEAECRALCAQRGWTVREVFVDNDLSASTGKRRPGFEALLGSTPEAVVCWHVDRLVRVTRDLELVISLGIHVHTVAAGHLDLSNPAGIAVARTITAWSTYEVTNKARRQLSKNSQKRDAGGHFWTIRPLGFELDGTHHAEEAGRVRTAYADVASGKSLSSIARAWTAGGARSARSKPWTTAPLSKALAHPRNAGLATYGGEVVGRAAWEGLVTEEVWRAHMRSRPVDAKTGRPGSTLLSSIAQCVRGNRMTRVNANGYPAYLCIDHCTTFRMQWADEVIEHLVLEQLSQPGFTALFHVDRSAQHRELLDEADALRERLDGMAIDYADGVLTRSMLRAGSERASERLARVELDLGRIDQGSTFEGFREGGGAREAWAKLDSQLHRKRAIIKAMTRRIVLHPVGRGRRVFSPDLVQVDWLVATPASSALSSLHDPRPAVLAIPAA